MMLTTQRELSQRIQSANFILWTSPRALEVANTYGLFAHAKSGGIIRRGINLICNCFVNSDVRRASRLDLSSAEALSNIGSIDSVIDVSGYNYGDECGINCTRYGLAWADYCNNHGIHYICIPQAWGPFRNPKIAKGTRQICEYSSLVYARDKISLSYLKDLLESSYDKVKIAPDIAFLFSCDKPQVGRQILIAQGIDIEKSPIVGIAPNIRIYNRYKEPGIQNKYIQLLIRIVEHCIKAWDASIVLLPHVFSMGERAVKDDRFLCGLVKAGVTTSDRCFMIKTYLSASALKSVESQLDFMIGSRFHGLIFTLSSGIPSFALGWSHKYPELLELIGLEGHSLLHTQFDDNNLIKLLEMAWEKKDQSKVIIRENITKINKQSETVFDDVAEILYSR